jgi:peroxiredoxin
MIRDVGTHSLDALRRVHDIAALQDQEIRARADAARQRQPDFAAAVDRLVERLRRYGVGKTAPKLGDPIPSFVLPDHAGQMISLDRLLAQGPVALTFHRGYWCAYSRINLNALVQAQQIAASAGGQIVAIMPEAQRFIADLERPSDVSFQALIDMDSGYALSLNLLTWVGVEIRRMMDGRQGVPILDRNNSWMLPIPATFVVGRDGHVRARFMELDYRKPLAISGMLAALGRSAHVK